MCILATKQLHKNKHNGYNSMTCRSEEIYKNCRPPTREIGAICSCLQKPAHSNELADCPSCF